MELSFTVYGNPLPKQRPRFSKYGVYTPKATRDWEKTISDTALLVMRELSIFTGTIAVEVSFYRRTKRRVDIDNLKKAVFDAMNGIVFNDDYQIIHSISSKFVGCGNPRVEVRVWNMTYEELKKNHDRTK